MAIARQRDLDTVRAGLSRWAGTTVDRVTQPVAGGLSSDTYMFRANGRELVARIAPAGDALFPTYDLAGQAAIMQTLAAHAVVPVPAVIAYVDDVEILGAPFVVMERVDGRVPTDNPPYLTTGWVHNASPAEQRALHERFLECLARVHGFDGGGLPLRAGLRADVDWWTVYLDWVADGTPPVGLADALAWCRAELPPDEPAAALLWGDVRIPNVVFDDAFRPCAVLDWEIATLGPAEVDLGWFLAMHRMSVDAVGADLPGFIALDDVPRAYERKLGRPLRDLHWYLVWAAVRSAAIMVRLGRLLFDLELLPDLRMQERNPSTKLLRTLLSS